MYTPALLKVPGQRVKNYFNDGRSFQNQVEITCDEYEKRGLARIKKVDPPVRTFGCGAARKVVFRRNPFLDFIGCICVSGRMVVLETKSTELGRLPINVKESGLTGNQCEALKQWAKCDAIAGLLWSNRSANAIRYIPWEDLRPHVEKHEASLKWTQNLGYDVPQGLGMALVDFLPVLFAAHANE